MRISIEELFGAVANRGQVTPRRCLWAGNPACGGSRPARKQEASVHTPGFAWGKNWRNPKTQLWTQGATSWLPKNVKPRIGLTYKNPLWPFWRQH